MKFSNWVLSLTSIKYSTLTPHSTTRKQPRCHVYMCFAYMSVFAPLCVVINAHGGQKRASPGRVLRVYCEPPCGCCESIPVPLEDQPELLSTELSLQCPHKFHLKKKKLLSMSE